jgi:hypothetical protein
MYTDRPGTSPAGPELNSNPGHSEDVPVIRLGELQANSYPAYNEIYRLF